MKTIAKEEFCSHIREMETAMYRYALGMLCSPHDAEDAVGETVLKAWASLETLKAAGSFRAWCFAILANQVRSMLRARSRTELTERPEQYGDRAGMQDGKQNDEQEGELWQLVTELPAKFRNLVILYYYEGFSVKEIARMEELSEGTVKSRLCRAREKLKRLLEEDAG